MILWKSGSRYYEMAAGAYVCDADGHELQRVLSKADVVAFLRLHPDRDFELAGNLQTPGQKMTRDPDLNTAVLCGSIRYDSRTAVLENVSFDTQ